MTHIRRAPTPSHIGSGSDNPGGADGIAAAEASAARSSWLLPLPAAEATPGQVAAEAPLSSHASKDRRKNGSSETPCQVVAKATSGQVRAEAW